MVEYNDFYTLIYSCKNIFFFVRASRRVFTHVNGALKFTFSPLDWNKTTKRTCLQILRSSRIFSEKM